MQLCTSSWSQVSSTQKEAPLHRCTLLAPLAWQNEHRFQDVKVDPKAHGDLLADIQRFRGAAYVADGAVSADTLTPDGRHLQTIDPYSWHFLIRNAEGEVISCARYHAISNPTFEDTLTSRAAHAQSPEWQTKVRLIVEDSIQLASRRGANFAELGGWCVAPASRNTSHALRTVLHMYALGEILGGTVGLSTATTRHASSSILQRLGASRAELHGHPLPSYFDPTFNCHMDLLQFDSLRPAPKYAGHVTEYIAQMSEQMQVVCGQPNLPTYSASLLALSKALQPVTSALVGPRSQSLT
jgi:hypothetical protein